MPRASFPTREDPLWQLLPRRSPVPTAGWFWEWRAAAMPRSSSMTLRIGSFAVTGPV